MKYTIIEINEDNKKFIDKFRKELKKGLVIIPSGVIKVIQFETEEDLE